MPVSGLNQSETIDTSEIPVCLFCGGSGRVLYDRLRDRYLIAPGQWALLECRSCELVWLNPRPLPDEIKKLYASYYTHSVRENSSWLKHFRNGVKRGIWASQYGYSQIQSGWFKLIGRGLSVVSPFASKAARELLYLDGTRCGNLLDVGCGNGTFLRQMRELGWNTYGVEPDPEAAKVAREAFGLDVRRCELTEAGFADEFFDALTLSHVIEHVSEPVVLLRRCARLLKRGGTLVVATPNALSLGHRWLRESWRELDPPRHFNIFTRKTLLQCAELAGFEPERVYSSGRNAAEIWQISRGIQRTGKASSNSRSLQVRFEGMIVGALEKVWQTFTADAISEEIVLVARKS